MHHDQLGSTAALSDASGTVIAAMHYSGANMRPTEIALSNIINDETLPVL